MSARVGPKVRAVDLVLGGRRGRGERCGVPRVAELAALLVAREGSPILAVGSFVIDIVPQPFEEFAIATFGEYDKVALLLGPRPGRASLPRRSPGVLQFLRPPLGVVALGSPACSRSRPS